MADMPLSERSHRSTDTFEISSRRIRVERFQPPGRGPHPALLVLHGADGLPGRGLAYHAITANFASQGYLAFLPHYFDATDGGSRPNPLNPLNFAAWLTAIGQAIGYVLRQEDVTPGRVGLVGFSLGGYLAVAAASQDRRVAAVVECCGGAADFFVRGVETLPPILILHGGADPVVPVSEAHKLQRLLAEHGRPHEVQIYPGRGHQLTGPDFDDAVRRSLHFLGRYLGSESS
jgi:carboxymethylenebutenolidase